MKQMLQFGHLLHCKSYIPKKMSTTPEKQLRNACEYDEEEKARKLIGEGVDVNSFDERVC